MKLSDFEGFAECPACRYSGPVSKDLNIRKTLRLNCPNCGATFRFSIRGVLARGDSGWAPFLAFCTLVSAFACYILLSLHFNLDPRNGLTPLVGIGMLLSPLLQLVGWFRWPALNPNSHRDLYIFLVLVDWLQGRAQRYPPATRFLMYVYVMSIPSALVLIVRGFL